MVTVHRAFGYRLVMFINDHTPPHVHVFGQGGEAKIELGGRRAVTVIWANGISRGDLRRLVAEVRERHSMLLDMWRTIHA
jgi:hypothetical protein